MNLNDFARLGFAAIVFICAGIFLSQPTAPASAGTTDPDCRALGRGYVTVKWMLTTGRDTPPPAGATVNTACINLAKPHRVNDVNFLQNVLGRSTYGDPDLIVILSARRHP